MHEGRVALPDAPVPATALGGAARRRRIDPFHVLCTAAGIWARRAPAYAALSAIFHAPWLLYLSSRKAPFEVDVGVVLLAVALGMVATGPIAVAVAGHVRGHRETLLSCARQGAGRSRAALGAGFLTLAGALRWVLASGITLSLSVWVFSGFSPDREDFTSDLTAWVLGVVVACGALWVLTAYWVAVPVAVLDRRPALDSTDHSAELSRGNLLRVLFVLAVVVLLEVVAAVVIGRLLRREVGLAAPLLVYAAARVLVFAPLRAVACAVTHEELRLAKDGVGFEDVARVFD